ncbi:MAG TPA: PQQ-binding-like beta-propeller repeat protein [Planctomycetota bacterium]|nr:PQQ-binding-like beta-propeller repeat protein [Planctomycetota bacterium]
MKTMLLVGILAWGALTRATAAETGADWPEFRGPTGQGHSGARGLPLHWSSTKNIAWKRDIPGKGWSSPVVRSERIYLTTAVAGATDRSLSLRALALDAGSGRTLWDVEVFKADGSSGIHKKNSHASPTPLAAEDRLYVHFGHEGTAALDLDGKVVWRQRSLRYPPVHGSGGSPVLAGDALIMSFDGASDPFIAALDRSTGNVLWKTPRKTDANKTFSFSTPLLIRARGRDELVSPASNAVVAYDPRTGGELWRVRYDGYSVVPRPVHGHGLVFLSTGYDSPRVLAVRPGGDGDVTATHIAWTARKGAPNTPSLLLEGDEVYMVSDGGVASCLDARTGTVHWQNRVSGPVSASPVLAGGRIHVIDEDGLCVVLKPGKSFEKLAENDLEERTLASPAVVDNAILVRTEKSLYRIEEKR